MRKLLFLVTICLVASVVIDSRADTISGPSLWILGDSQACGAIIASNTVLMTRFPAWRYVKHECKVGSRVSYWETRIDKVPLAIGDYVLIYLGSNDWGGHPNALPLLSKLRGTRCVFVGPPLIRGRNGAASALKNQVISDGTCRYLDSRELHLKQPDGVHTVESERWLRAALDLFFSVAQP